LSKLKISPKWTFFQPPVCDALTGSNLLQVRYKRQTVELDETRGVLYDTDREDLKVKVYSGLYVSEASDLEEDFDHAQSELVSKDIIFQNMCCKHYSQGIITCVYMIYSESAHRQNI